MAKPLAAKRDDPQVGDLGADGTSGVVYVFGGIAKLNPDWLFHAQPLRIWLYNSGDVPPVGPEPLST